MGVLSVRTQRNPEGLLTDYRGARTTRLMPPKNDWNHTDIRSSYWNISGMWMMRDWALWHRKKTEVYWRRPYLKRWIISRKLRYKRLNIKSRSPIAPNHTLAYGTTSLKGEPHGSVSLPPLTGVLTNPTRHNVPVTPEEMAEAVAQDGATGCTFTRNQTPGMGHLPTWTPKWPQIS